MHLLLYIQQYTFCTAINCIQLKNIYTWLHSKIILQRETLKHSKMSNYLTIGPNNLIDTFISTYKSKTTQL